MSRANIYNFFKQPDDLENKIEQGCEYLKTGRFGLAENTFTNLLENGGLACEIDTGLICAKYWNIRIPIINEQVKGLKRANYLLNEWKNFKEFLKRIQRDGTDEKENISAFADDIVLLTGHYILEIAINDLVDEYHKKSFPDIDLLIVIGESFIELEEFKKAIETLEYARVFNKKDPNILALLADSYYGFGEVQKAKVLFKEAFFLNPNEIPLEKIRCEIIHDLVNIINSHNYTNVAPWIPVFGMITNNFNISKELNEQEAQELLIEVDRLENEYHGIKNQNVLPYLLSKYLYLIDFLENQLNSKMEAEKLKIKIKKLEPKIYDLYIKNIKS